MNITRIKELEKCYNDFSYFAANYVKIIHPTRGLLSFNLHPYQKRLWETYDKERFVIVKKWRQGGFSTLSSIWGLYQCMFKLDQHIMIAGGRDIDATNFYDNIIKPTLQLMPEWMMPNISKETKHCIKFGENESALYFSTLVPAKGRRLDAVIIDEAAFIKNMDRNWKALWPMLSMGGKCFVVSTTNGVGNWFQETYHNAVEKKNNFFVFESHYLEHPDWQDKIFAENARRNLGIEAWHQEVLGNFVVNYDEQKDSTTPL